MNLADGMSTCARTGLIVDDKGAPIIMYHGTRREFACFEAFRPSGAIGNPPGIYFTPLRGVAEEYAQNDDGEMDEKSRVIAAFIKMETECDGAVIQSDYRGLEVVVFDPKNIFIKEEAIMKSPLNVTAFHGTDSLFERFDCEAKHDLHTRRLGAYFSANKEVASLYGDRVIQAEISFIEPLDIRGADARTAIDLLPISSRERAELGSAFRGTDYAQYGLLESLSPMHLRARLIAANYDGIIYSEAGNDAFIAFYPHQIKMRPVIEAGYGISGP